MRRLWEFLKSRGALVRAVVLPSPNGQKVGLDDWLVQGHDSDELFQLAATDLPAVEHQEPGEPAATG